MCKNSMKTETIELCWGIKEDLKTKKCTVDGVEDTQKILKDFWNNINNKEKVSFNILALFGVFSLLWALLPEVGMLNFLFGDEDTEHWKRKWLAQGHSTMVAKPQRELLKGIIVFVCICYTDSRVLHYNRFLLLLNFKKSILLVLKNGLSSPTSEPQAFAWLF